MICWSVRDGRLFQASTDRQCERGRRERERRDPSISSPFLHRLSPPPFFSPSSPKKSGQVKSVDDDGDGAAATITNINNHNIFSSLTHLSRSASCRSLSPHLDCLPLAAGSAHPVLILPPAGKIRSPLPLFLPERQQEDEEAHLNERYDQDRLHPPRSGLSFSPSTPHSCPFVSVKPFRHPLAAPS